MTEEELNNLGAEIFRYVKNNFPNALTWPVRSIYNFTIFHEDTIMIIYERTFINKNSYLPPTDCLYLKLEHIDNWLDNLYIDSLCKYKRVKDYK